MISFVWNWDTYDLGCLVLVREISERSSKPLAGYATSHGEVVTGMSGSRRLIGSRQNKVSGDVVEVKYCMNNNHSWVVLPKKVEVPIKKLEVMKKKLEVVKKKVERWTRTEGFYIVDFRRISVTTRQWLNFGVHLLTLFTWVHHLTAN